jgi:ribosome-binding factor A
MRPEKDGPTQRHERLGQLLLDELRGLFRDDVEDPSLYGVQIAAVVLSVDYRHLRVHYTCQGNTPTRALERVTPFLRARLADAVDLKRVPELSFIRDV